jgi:hypothetical protein
VRLVPRRYSCGVVEDTTVVLDGTTYFDTDGSWLRNIIRFTDNAFTDPASDMTIAFKTRQVVELTPETVTLR